MIESSLIAEALKKIRKAMIHDMHQSDLSFEGLAQKTNVSVSDIKTIITRRVNAISSQSLINLVSFYAKEWEFTQLVLKHWHQVSNAEKIWIGYLLYDSEIYT